MDVLNKDDAAGSLRQEPRKVYSASAQTGILPVLADLRDGLAQQAVWRTFAWDEIQQRYQRSALGIAWIVLSYLVFVIAISIFFGGFAQLGGGRFTAYVAFGFAAFTFLVGNLTDGVAVFTASRSWIKSASLPYSVYVYKSLARALFTFGIQLSSGLLLAFLFFDWRPGPLALLILPAFLIYLLNAVWVQYGLGLFAARFGDVQHLVSTVQRLLFFTTPILWVYEERSGAVRRIADFNPLTHFIEILRAPLLGEWPDGHSLIFVAGFTIAGWALTLLAASRMKRRLPFWI